MLFSLDKAPSFDNVGPFERETKSLFPVHVHQTEQGLIFVNLSADPNVVSFEVRLINQNVPDLKVYHRNLTKELSRFDFKDFELLLFGCSLLTVAITRMSKREISTGRHL